MLRRATVALAAAVNLALGAAAAHADPGIPDVGYGYPNDGRSVQCVQFFVNNHLNLHLVEDGKFGPRTERGVGELQRHSNRNWATQELVVDGIFGKATGEVVLKHVKRHPWTIDYEKASRCAHYVPSCAVVLG